MENLSKNHKRAGFAWLPVIVIGGAFLAVIASGAVYLEYQQIKSTPKIDGKFDEVGSQIKMDTPLDAAKEIYNRLVNRFFAPLPIAPINLDSVPSDSTEELRDAVADTSLGCKRTGNTPEDDIIYINCINNERSIEDEPSGGSTVQPISGKLCFSSIAYEEALTAFENTVAVKSAYELALKAYGEAWGAYNVVRGTDKQSAVSYPDSTQAYRDVSSASGASLDAYDVLIEAYEANISKCAQPDADKADACVDKYDQATLDCLSMDGRTADSYTDASNRCYIDASRTAIQTCFR